MIVPVTPTYRPADSRADAMVNNGMGGNPNYEISAAVSFFLACLMGIGLWNAGEIILVTYLKYRRLRTLYFWSILTSATGVIVCTLSQIINIWVIGRSDFVPAALGSFGWVLMVTGQSLVLYSRLHMLYIDARTLRYVLTMIIFDATTLHSIGIVLIVGSNSPHPGPFLFPYSIVEKLQVTAFFIQEAVLSGLYLWSSRKFMKKHARGLEDSRDSNVRAVKSTLRELIIMNSIVILLDVAILVLEYLGLYIFQLSGKNFVYSVKLKIELSVLNQLKDFVKRTRCLDQSFQQRNEAEQRQNIERQWESALRRAFGSISRSLGRTRSAETEYGMQESPGHDMRMLGSTRSRMSHVSTTAVPPEFFNIEVVYSSTAQRSSSTEEPDSKSGDSDGQE